MESKKAERVEVGRIAAGDQSRRRICQTSMTSSNRKENREHAALIRPACREALSLLTAPAQPFSQCSSHRVNGKILIFILLLIIISVVIVCSQLTTIVAVIPKTAASWMLFKNH